MRAPVQSKSCTQGTLTLYGMAVLVQEASGNVAVEQAADEARWVLLSEC